MRDSIVEVGKKLPESEEEFQQLKQAGKAKFINCQTCKKEFSSLNTHTVLGWRETQITGDCETCFDRIWSEV
jgi:hypothetical protein